MAEENFQGEEVIGPNDASDSSGNWLPCLEWTGNEKELPLGGWIAIPGMKVSKFVYRWKVADAEEEQGYVLKKSSEIKKDDILIGAVINNKLYEQVIGGYGPNSIRITLPNTTIQVNRMQWRDRFGTDGLELWALRVKRQEFNPGGIIMG
jgi:hypothetical protein